MSTEPITCQICQDLIPLVQDGVASPDSVQAVQRHAQGCPACQALLGQGHPAAPPPNDGRVLGALRRRLQKAGFTLLAAGILLGIFLTNSAGMFYNLGLMPLVGAAAHWLLGPRWWWAPAAVFGLNAAWMLAGWLMGTMPLAAALSSCLVYGLAYGALCLAGWAVAALLRYAFVKEEVQ